MARFEYISPESASAEQWELFGAIESTIGRVSNFMRLMARVPHLLRWTFPLGIAAQRDAFAVTPFEIRNLAIVKTSLIYKCEY